MIELGRGRPSRLVVAHHGMPMLDIKCQSLCPDAARVVTNPVGVRPGLRPPHGALCGDNTLLIEFVLRIHAPGVAFLGQGCK